MKKINLFKQAISSVAGIAFAAGILFSASPVHAIQYTGATTQPSPVPAFNVYTGVDQGVGNENDFLRARVPVATPDTSTLYANNIAPTCDNGQNIQMRVYIHNGASADNNNGGTGASVAHGTSVKVTLPTDAASSFSPSAQISSTNASTVNDTTYINCNGKMVKLTYVAGSAKANSIGTGTVALSDSLVTTGASISSRGVTGDVWGCWDERVYVIFTVKVEVLPTITPAVCDLIKATTSGQTITVNTVNYTANNATVNGLVLDFGNGVTKNITSSELPYSYTYTTAGNYTVKATVKTSLGDVTSAACATPVTTTSTPATCDLITITTSGKTVTVTKVNYTTNNAVVTGLVLDFGNGVSKTIAFSDLPYSYTYATDGSYSVKATVKTSLGDVSGTSCVASVKPVTVTPPKLPDTGAGNTIAVFVGATFIGAFLYRMRVLRNLN